MNQVDVTLYLVTDRAGLSQQAFLQRVEQACQGGVTLVQLREKHCGGRELLALAQAVKQITDRYGVPLLIDDRVDVAIACGCAGVHVGQDDLPAAVARQLLGPDRIVGVTAKTLEQAREAWQQGADYLGVGAMYATATKEEAKVTSPAMLDAIAQSVPIPVVAIGGLNRQTLGILQGTRADGAAVVRGLMAAQDPCGEARQLRQDLARLLLPPERRKA